MSDPLVQQQETGTMTTDRTGNKERTHAAKDGESHASHDTASAPDHSNRELPEGEVLEGKETQTAEAENRNKNGQERDDKKGSMRQQQQNQNRKKQPANLPKMQQQQKTYQSGRNIRSSPAGTWQPYPSWPMGFTSPRFAPTTAIYGYAHPGTYSIPSSPPPNSSHQRSLSASDSQDESEEKLSKTNLYIRGLPPATTDEDLNNLCSRIWLCGF